MLLPLRHKYKAVSIPVHKYLMFRNVSLQFQRLATNMSRDISKYVATKNMKNNMVNRSKNALRYDVCIFQVQYQPLLTIVLVLPIVIPTSCKLSLSKSGM